MALRVREVMLFQHRAYQLRIAAKDFIQQIAALDIVRPRVAQTRRRIVQQLVHCDGFEADEGLLVW